MARGSRKGEDKAGPEWIVHDVDSGADPDDWEFYPPQDIPQNPAVEVPGWTSEGFTAFFSQRRRHGGG